MNKSKVFYFSLIIMVIIFAHFILPKYNNHNDILIFSTWSLYSNPSYQVVDLTWDNGETYFFRDYAKDYQKKRKNINAIYSNAINNNINWLRNNINYLLDYCNCNKIQFHKLNINISDHILFKEGAKFKPLQVVDL